MVAARVGVLLIAAAAAGVGVFGLMSPERIGDLVSFMLLDNGARGEVRAIYGGMSLAIAFILVWGAIRGRKGRPWLLSVAIAFGGLATGRVVSLMLDGLTGYTVLAGVLEGAIAGFLAFAAFELGRERPEEHEAASPPPAPQPPARRPDPTPPAPGSGDKPGPGERSSSGEGSDSGERSASDDGSASADRPSGE